LRVTQEQRHRRGLAIDGMGFAVEAKTVSHKV